MSLPWAATQKGVDLRQLLFVRSCNISRGGAGLCPAPPRTFPPSNNSAAVLRGKAELLAHEEDERGKEDAQRHQKVRIEKISRRPYALPHQVTVDARFKQAREHKIQLVIAPRRIIEEKIGQQQDGRGDPGSQHDAQDQKIVPAVAAAFEDNIQNDDDDDSRNAYRHRGAVDIEPRHQKGSKHLENGDT